jgi:peptidoglycan-binding protein ArfA
MKTSGNHKSAKSNRSETRRAWRLSLTGVAIVSLALALFSACSSGSPGSQQPPAPVAAEHSMQKVDLRGVEFNRDGALLPSSRPVLDAAAELIKTQPDAKVYVDAYTDPSGGPSLNERLSSKRATAVKEYFVKDGIAPGRLVARGFGASNFVANNDDRSGRKQNRRIELVIVGG